jgi:F420-dependent oxidoreductase-like protein
MKKLKIGVQLSARRRTPQDWRAVEDVARECEALGYESIWIGDHLFGSRLECWTFLSALSTLTHKIRLGTLVLCNGFRNPALLAKMGATLDVISNGRLELGLGAGWSEAECRAYGFPFPKNSVRIDQMREGIEIIKRMWTEDAPSYAGRYYQIREAPCDPKPVQKPHPPITIGGGGEKYTLKVVAAHADRWNFGGPLELYERKMKTLKEYCIQMGRDFQQIEKSFFSFLTDVYLSEEDRVKALRKAYTAVTPYRKPDMAFEDWVNWTQARYIIGTSETCIKKLRELIDANVTHVIVKFPDLLERKESLRLFKEEVITHL